jgi:glucuronate isomerase
VHRVKPDRYLEGGAAQELALELYRGVAELPIVSPHGHIDVELLSHPDARLPPPGRLFVTSDHYVLRLLHAHGVPLDDLGVGLEVEDRVVWERFAERFAVFAGTPVALWLRETLVTVLGLEPRVDAAAYDAIEERLASPELAPWALLDRFRVETISTTDAAGATLDEHRTARERVGDRLRPTFRPDAVAALDAPGWRASLAQLEQVSGREIVDYDGYVEALAERRAAFKAHGATATDHGATAVDTTPLAPAEASAAFSSALAGTVTAQQARRFEAHMLHVHAGLSIDDGLVMQLHLGSLRNHDGPLAARFGPDIGADIPVAADWTRGLQPLLESYGREPGFRVVAYTLDETTYSRELAPLAGHYPALVLGSPWWFHDSPAGIVRFLDRVTETAGIAKLAGFVDDARALTAIPVRHDLWRRRTCGWLARQVAAGLIEEEDTPRLAHELAYGLTKRSYNV